MLPWLGRWPPVYLKSVKAGWYCCREGLGRLLPVAAWAEGRAGQGRAGTVQSSYSTVQCSTGLLIHYRTRTSTVWYDAGDL
jgi:hypothetical protein